jgi:hypothetical protein
MVGLILFIVNYIWRERGTALKDSLPNFVILVPYTNNIGSRKPRLMAVGICCADHATPFIRKSWY